MNGHIGELDKLVPHLITEHKTYGRDRITPRTVSAEDGVIKKKNGRKKRAIYVWNLSIRKMMMAILEFMIHH